MASIWISIFLLTLVRNAVSDYDPSVCSIMEESYGLIPPPLPTNFEMKSEVVDHQGGYSAYEEMYFDYTNSRAKYKYLLGSIEYNYLFDYAAEQIVEWIKVHPGTSMKRDPLSHSCEAVNMEESPFAYIFGYQDWMYLRPKMFNSNQVLRYGGQYLYAANGTERLDERGLKVNKFIGCIYEDSINATMLNDYYFAETTFVQPSGGTPSSIVTGSDVKPLSVPIKLHVTGRRYIDEKRIPINKTHSVSWFKGEPQFEIGTFQIPPWIHCEGYRGSKDIPKFPKAFSTRVTIASFQIDTLGQLQAEYSSESYEQIFYDSEKKLARRDFTPTPLTDTDIYSKFGTYTPVSTIYDFNEGLRYTINKPSGSCYIYPIVDNEYFDTEESLTYRKLATPEEIFLMQMDDMEYKGKAFTRDIECNVWNGKHFHEKYGATFVKESYFSTNGWHELADGMVEYSVPVKNVLIKKELDGEVAEGISTYNFLKFKGKAPKMAVFDIKGCVELIDHKRFAIELPLDKDFSETVFKYRIQFLEAAQLYIANQTQIITPLRVQRLYIRPQSISNGRVFLVFTLLDKANLNNLPIVMGQSGKSLAEAIVLLQKLIDSGKFSVQFANPTNKDEIITVVAERGSLYSLTPSGSFTKTPLIPAKLQESDNQQNSNEKANIASKYTYEEHKGMTSGHLALLSFAMLFIGIGIGIALMYLYIRIYSERHVEDRISLTPTPGPSTAEGSELAL